MLSFLLFSVSLAAAFTEALLPDGRPNGNVPRKPAVPKILGQSSGPVVGRDGSVLPPYDTIYFFNQLIDHSDPSKGTFRQRYWHTWEFYEEGGPIILSTPGETNAGGYDGYLTNRTMNGLIAQQQSGATIVLEHRFFGFSNPYNNLSVASFSVHTVQQAIDDLVYFAENVVLPMPGGSSVTPATNPWILVGGSYPGALTGWTMINKPGVFYAGYSSSGVAQAITNFWQYYEPIRQNMPKNCSADVQAAISSMDDILLGSNQTAKAQLKASFGLSALSHSDDFAGALRNNLWDWQLLQPTSGSNTAFRRFCDALEVNAQGNSAPESGWSASHAIQAWAAYFKGSYLPALCGGIDAESCLGTYDATQPYWTDIGTDNEWRSWNWMVCNEVGWYQTAAPTSEPSLVSRLVQPIYEERQCILMFPEAFSNPPSPNVDETNAEYKGWDIRVDRLFSANGIRDPWKDATLSADGLNIESTALQPVKLSDGFHCSDLSSSSGAADGTIRDVQLEALRSIKEWIAAYVPPGSSYKRQSPMPPNKAGFAPGSTDDGEPNGPATDIYKAIHLGSRGFGVFDTSI